MENDFEKAQTLVIATIRKLGLDPTTTLVAGGTDTAVAWTLKRGSASVLVTVARHDGERGTFLRIASPVVTLPTDQGKQVAMMRRLLELNAAGLANAAFGLMENRVVAVSERPAAGLDAGEVEQMVMHLSAVADTFDDRLAKEFGALKA